MEVSCRSSSEDELKVESDLLCKNFVFIYQINGGSLQEGTSFELAGLLSSQNQLDFRFLFVLKSVSERI